MQHTKYQRPRPRSFRQEDFGIFFFFFKEVFVKLGTPNAGPLFTQG